MSLFFDVWTAEGFVLASDVRLTITGDSQASRYLHKLSASASKARVNCAIAVCGDYPESCLGFFRDATARKDNLRDVAYYFAQRWTERFADTTDYSAVHIVGFESIPTTDLLIPQCWLWFNWWDGQYRTEAQLRSDLQSFSQAIPYNNHMPWMVHSRTNEFPQESLLGQRAQLMEFLNKFQPLFTWNGDVAFWMSASQAILSALNLSDLWGGRRNLMSLDDTARLAKICLQFLSEIGGVLPQSSVGLTPDRECDLLIVRPEGIEARWASLPQ